MLAKHKRVRIYGIECPVCLDEMYSTWVHDFRECTCGYVFVDGGREYLRYGWGVDGTQEGGKPKHISKLINQQFIWSRKHDR